MNVGRIYEGLNFYEKNDGRCYAIVGDSYRLFPERGFSPKVGKKYTVEVTAVKAGNIHGHVRGEYAFVKSLGETKPKEKTRAEKVQSVMHLLREYSYSLEQASRMWEQAHT